MDTTQSAILPGSKVTLHFSIKLLDGTLVETTLGDDPITFTVGDGTLIEGMEIALYGLKAGDKQSLRIGPEHAYGYRDAENIHEMDRAQFAADMVLKPGVVVGFELPSGEQVPGTIIEVNESKVKVDFSHPLASREIIFDVHILDVVPRAQQFDRDSH